MPDDLAVLLSDQRQRQCARRPQGIDDGRLAAVADVQGREGCLGDVVNRLLVAGGLRPANAAEAIEEGPGTIAVATGVEDYDDARLARGRGHQDIRAGRWWWEMPEHKECGLHKK